MQESNSTAVTKLFTEMLRPTELDQIILPRRIYDEVSKGLTSNFLFHGPAGTGKTTLTRVLSKGYDTLTINGSEENGIDVIRDKILSFCATYSLVDSQEIKVVVFEEGDGLTTESWKALRAVIEKYSDSVRFIINCNYTEKIPEPILSRLNVIAVYPINEEEREFVFKSYENRIKSLLRHVKISYTDEAVREFVKMDFPDMRSLYNKIQSLHVREASELSKDSLTSSYDFGDVFSLACDPGSDPWENYKLLVSNYTTNADDVIIAFGKSFPEYLRINKPEYIRALPLIVIAIADHQQNLSTVPDKFITLLSLIYKTQTILKSIQ